MSLSEGSLTHSRPQRLPFHSFPAAFTLCSPASHFWPEAKMWLFISTVETFFSFKTSRSEACLVSLNTEKSTGTRVHAARWQKNPPSKRQTKDSSGYRVEANPRVKNCVKQKKRIMCGSCLKSSRAGEHVCPPPVQYHLEAVLRGGRSCFGVTLWFWTKHFVAVLR